eukprot:Blabericola_migrator_1__12907@NODE_846_length_6285_cov_66_757961_g598_i0_p1_GENE_NODE_846_length_6285_cov_66_757961_g598_i0NODE_846_length_6285_cov_66_757961_g598_i0_p1_ORF_typecomplete_len409_score48_10ANAPC4_WD40/PF12894_7/0_0026ANAPC4_WD40/PF12894_7/0_04ANAPC4_WD40/PF12894_7/0_048ANAPC4_WD40/PF12894_7/4_9e02eIF2A/PF08662_11/1_7e02eIF2A/PF08662_11/0_00022WD40_like/PF17005_5/8_7WD40_like/PF17005_5/0_43Cytochrom_D1/PF02239_16/0_52WD40/PF00400_32/34WD40/PF00400_32/19_NODE_846_length_6285_cov_66_7
MWNVSVGTLQGGLCGYELSTDLLSIDAEPNVNKGARPDDKLETKEIPAWEGKLKYASNIHQKACRLLSGTRDAKFLVSGSVDETGSVFNLKTNKQVAQIDCRGEPCCLEFIQIKGVPFIATACEQGILQLIRSGSWSVVHEVKIPQVFMRNRRLGAAAWQPEMTHVVALRFSDGLCGIYDVNSRALMSTWKAKEYMTSRGFKWSPSGQVIVTAFGTGFTVRHVSSGKHLKVDFPRVHGTVACIALCDDAIFVGGQKGSVVAYALTVNGEDEAAEIVCVPWVEVTLPPMSDSMKSDGTRVAHLGLHKMRETSVLMAVQANGQLSCFNLSERDIDLEGVFDTMARPTSVYIGLPTLRSLGLPSLEGEHVTTLKRRQSKYGDAIKRRRLMGDPSVLLQSFKAQEGKVMRGS